MATQGLQMPPTFYKPDPNSPNVYDAQGNLVSLQQYKQATGQTDVPDNQLNWSAVQNTQVPPPQNSAGSIWDVPGMKALMNTLTPADQAFVQSMWTLQQQQYTSGGSGSIDQGSIDKAMQIMATDPNIKAQYGDAAALAAKDLAFSLQQITNNQATGQAALAATQLQQRQQLEQQIASSGQAYSGFRQQAQNQLAAQQADVIQSTRSQLQQQIQQLGSGYESAYGSAFPGTGGSSTISAGGPLTGQVTYQPTGGIIGTQNQAQYNAEQSLGQQLGILPSVSSTGVLNYGGTK
jgi:hypothetical protein